MHRLVSLLLMLALLACAQDRGPVASSSGGSAAAPDVRWLCRPDRPEDPCTSANLDATELAADGSHAALPHRRVGRAARNNADCFYVYPTVDLDLVPGIHLDLQDTRKMEAVTLAQAARFTEACTLWVPLYRQITLGMWLQPPAELERALAIAYGDVARAFAAYLARAESGRRVVLIGHSQGAEMVVRLLRQFFDGDAAMRERLLLAMAIGGRLDVPAGKTTGGTLQNVPICTRPLQTGCVLGYRTHLAGELVDPERWGPPSGHETVCVNPAALDSGHDVPLSRAYFPVGGDLGIRDQHHVTTPFVVVRDFYGARCERGPRGYGYLAVDVPRVTGDARGEGPVDLRSRRLRLGKLGLHVLDLQLAQGDLVDLVARRVARLQ